MPLFRGGANVRENLNANLLETRTVCALAFDIKRLI